MPASGDGARGGIQSLSFAFEDFLLKIVFERLFSLVPLLEELFEDLKKLNLLAILLPKVAVRFLPPFLMEVSSMGVACSRRLFLPLNMSCQT
jgi:hypothetical protein